jgi:hypothetical protein
MSKLTLDILFPLVLFVLNLSGCRNSSDTPGAQVAAFLKQSGTFTHGALAPGAAGPVHPDTIEPKTVVQVGSRTVRIDFPLKAFSANQIKPPLDVELRGADYAYSRHFTDWNTEEERLTPRPPVIVDAVVRRVDVLPVRPLTGIVISSKEDAGLGTDYTIHAEHLSFSYSSGGSGRGRLLAHMDSPPFEKELLDALVAAGFERGRASVEISAVKRQLMDMSDRAFLIAALGSDVAALERERDLTESIRGVNFQWRIDAEWAVAAKRNGHDLVAVKRVWHSKELPCTFLFEEFDDTGVEVAAGSLSVKDLLTPTEVVERIDLLCGSETRDGVSGEAGAIHGSI